MLYKAKRLNFGAEQTGLDLKETNGSVVCSECETQFEVNEEDLKRAIKQDETAE